MTRSELKALWPPLAVVALLLALLVFLLDRSASPDLALRRNIQEQLQLLSLNDAELTRDAMLTRAGLLPNYDALLRARARLLERIRQLHVTAHAGSPHAAIELAPHVEALERTLLAKLDDVERFKSDDAQLRTSAAFLTYTISRMTIDSDVQRAMAAEVRQLSSTFLRFLQSPGRASADEFKAALALLASRGKSAEDEDLRTLVSHGVLVADRLPQVVDILRRITAAGTGDGVAGVWAGVERVGAQAERVAQVYRHALFSVALVLLAYVVVQFARLRVTAHRLQHTNVQLGLEIGERVQAEGALRASEERFRAMAESAHDAIVSIDGEERVASWNPGAQAAFGHAADEAVGMPFGRLMAPGVMQVPDWPATLEAEGVRKDGGRFPIEASVGRWSTANGSFTTVIVRDVSQRKRLEETTRQQELQLLQANKLAALGTLVSGVAHEINNPNQMVMLNSSVLSDTWRDACAALDAHRETEGEFTLAGLPYSEMRGAASTLIRDVHEGARRIDRIVQDLKDFARPRRSDSHAELDLNDVVDRAVRLLRHPIAKRTRKFELALAAGLPSIHGDAQQVEQVLVNLLVNALEALPDPGRGVRVATRARPDGEGIEVEISDEGTGIDPEHLQRLCEPFFTTKQDSGGTGLGLAVTYSIVSAHGGRLDFDSEPGRGTRATVSFPLHRDGQPGRSAP